MKNPKYGHLVRQMVGQHTYCGLGVSSKGEFHPMLVAHDPAFTIFAYMFQNTYGL